MTVGNNSPYFKNVVALVPAAGMGTRLGLGPKAFLRLGDKTLLRIVVEKLSRCVRHIKVGIPPGFAKQAEQEVGSIAEVCEGGPSRQETVRRLFEGCSEDFVLIHEITRPFASLSLIKNVIREGMRCGAAMSALPVHTPVCLVSDKRNVSEAVSRHHAFLPQSPQLFRRDILEAAFRYAFEEKIETQTIWQLVLKIGTTLRLVPGEEENIKITTPFDWETANRILSHKV